jgi:hypothetical protein
MPRLPAIYRVTVEGREYWRGVRTSGPGPDLNLGAVEIVEPEEARRSYRARLKMNRKRWLREAIHARTAH